MACIRIHVYKDVCVLRCMCIGMYVLSYMSTGTYVCIELHVYRYVHV